MRATSTVCGKLYYLDLDSLSQLLIMTDLCLCLGMDIGESSLLILKFHYPSKSHEDFVKVHILVKLFRKKSKNSHV